MNLRRSRKLSEKASASAANSSSSTTTTTTSKPRKRPCFRSDQDEQEELISEPPVLPPVVPPSAPAPPDFIEDFYVKQMAELESLRRNGYDAGTTARIVENAIEFKSSIEAPLYKKEEHDEFEVIV